MFLGQTSEHTKEAAPAHTAGIIKVTYFMPPPGDSIVLLERRLQDRGSASDTALGSCGLSVVEGGLVGSIDVRRRRVDLAGAAAIRIVIVGRR